MKKPRKAIEILQVDPTCEEAKSLEKDLEHSIVVDKNPWRSSNQAFLFGAVTILLGLFIVHYWPEMVIAEGFGAIRLGPSLIILGTFISGWFKIGEMVKGFGEILPKISDLIQKLRGGGG
ncbi:hypothetical protein EHO57_13995 [Leptospira langatensis]|uniref:Uncharacterized protein n=1 Tax=Leptospira langatensis TaxID=2484983 RepID=A0A5R2AT01_9LEPT|nr:hypothetical protein [Leptospira langatensis]TGJ99867.1 hypothetical protein EHO57_13995 [Leptospira langatensis]